MSPHPHHGVVAVVTNTARTRFLVQRKDAGYRPRPRGLSLFGGAVEAGEAPEAALARELREELGPAAEALVAAGPRLVLAQQPLGAAGVVSLFEVCLHAEALEALATVPVLEGECAEVLDRQQLRTTPLVWGLSAVVAAYLDRTPVSEAR